jgi:hypothetical protein
MSKHHDKLLTIGPRDMSYAEQQAIVEALSHLPSTYSEEARRVLGNPLGYAEGRPMTQPEIVASLMAAGKSTDQ